MDLATSLGNAFTRAHRQTSVHSRQSWNDEGRALGTNHRSSVGRFAKSAPDLHNGIRKTPFAFARKERAVQLSHPPAAVPIPGFVDLRRSSSSYVALLPLQTSCTLGTHVQRTRELLAQRLAASVAREEVTSGGEGRPQLGEEDLTYNSTMCPTFKREGGRFDLCCQDSGPWKSGCSFSKHCPNTARVIGNSAKRSSRYHYPRGIFLMHTEYGVISA